jgi:preprotein translocase subunit Sss1
MVFRSPSSLFFSLVLFISVAGMAIAGAVPILADDVAKVKDLSGAAIPEPTVFGLIGIVGFLLMLRRRR